MNRLCWASIEPIPNSNSLFHRNILRISLKILPALIVITIHLIPKDTFNKFRKEAEGLWQNGKPQKWYYAIPIALIWIIVVWLVVRAVFL